MPTIPDREAQHYMIRPGVTAEEGMPMPFKILNSHGHEIGSCESVTIERELQRLQALDAPGFLMVAPTSETIICRNARLNIHSIDPMGIFTIKIPAVMNHGEVEFRGCYLMSYDVRNDSSAGHIHCSEMRFRINGLSINGEKVQISKKTEEWLERWAKR